jgi:hypothetical protein
LNYFKVLTTCFSERLFDAVTIILIVTIGIPVLGLIDFIPLISSNITVMISILLICLSGIFFILNGQFLSRFFSQYARWLLPYFENIKEAFSTLSNKKQVIQLILYTLLYWSSGSITMYLLLNSCPIPVELQTLELSVFIGGIMGLSLSLPSAPANIGIYNFTLLTIFNIVLTMSNISPTNTLSSTLVASTVIIHFGSIIPDFILGFFSYITLSKKIIVKD